MKFRTLTLIALLTACSGSTPTDFAGSYTVTVVNGSNDCNFANWTVGASTANIPVTMTQDGATAQMNINGIVGLYLIAVDGTSAFTGSVSGNVFTAATLGTKTITQGACSYTVNTKLSTTLDTNSVLSGTLTYTPITNGDASCGVLSTCSQKQTVSGARTGP